MRQCKSTGNITFWDAVTGHVFQRQDESCPLQNVSYLVSTDNIFHNIQGAKIKPASLDFNINNQRNWIPLHPDGFVPETIQEEKLTYSSPDIYHGKETQEELRESIQNAIRGWRRTATTFRSDVSAKLAQTLDKLEQSKIKPHSQPNPFTVPETMATNRSVFGFTLHFGVESIDEILSRIKSSEIHLNRNPQVEFAIGVRVIPYPGGILSTWVFVGSLVPK